MGPFFWLADALGCPDWIAQRLWLGTISLAAALGARWLFRRLGLGPRGRVRGRDRLRADAVPTRLHGADLGTAAPLGRAPVDRRAHDAGGASRRLARSRRHRAHRPDDRRGQRLRARPRGDRAPAVDRARALRRAGAGPGRARRRRPDRGPLAGGLRLVDRRALPPGLPRAADPAAHRERADGGGVVDARRRPARARELVLLRLRPQRAVAGAVARLPRQPGRHLLQLPRACARVPRGRPGAVAPPRLLRAVRRGGHDRRASVRGPTTTPPRGARSGSGSRATPRPGSRCGTRRARCPSSSSASPGSWAPASAPSGPRSCAASPRSRSWWWSRSRSCRCGATAT